MPTDIHGVAEESAGIGVGFLRAEVALGLTFASIGLSTNDENRRMRSTTNVRSAYNTLLRFAGRVVIDEEQARELVAGIEKLKKSLLALEERRWNTVGRRLGDRIRMLAAKAEEAPINSPASKEITELIQGELAEYFEREKNPLYGADRRRSS